MDIETGNVLEPKVAWTTPTVEFYSFSSAQNQNGVGCPEPAPFTMITPAS